MIFENTLKNKFRSFFAIHFSKGQCKDIDIKHAFKKIVKLTQNFCFHRKFLEKLNIK